MHYRNNGFIHVLHIRVSCTCIGGISIKRRSNTEAPLTFLLKGILMYAHTRTQLAATSTLAVYDQASQGRSNTFGLWYTHTHTQLLLSISLSLSLSSFSCLLVNPTPQWEKMVEHKQQLCKLASINPFSLGWWCCHSYLSPLALRIRPLTERDRAQPRFASLSENDVLRAQDGSVHIVSQNKMFHFDQVFKPSCTQSEIFATVGEKLVRKFVDGK